ncbi:aldehyde dehydrogenase [Planosporangium flavigriseum]|uniref:Aldehyde dehydrogenase n=1 Tax=Planosporangium flavigriseum TaxID=373681 RepID=A0A8J3LLL2_9ACTN|nr:aldehyde dehydrogenase family protein [Planosporangium flavigriseum]NJC65708.1 aldehyde dehydrogenase [Planosporangium flavigriseum]GIG73559.1 aldehyde dehydrogenase [Planosporangium flavigriseum]
MDAAKEFARLSGALFVDGGIRPSTATARKAVIDPATGLKLGEIADCTPAEVEEVVARANAAQRTWWAESALHRSEVLHEVARAMRRLKPQLAELLTRETGKPYKESADEVDWSVTATDYYAELGRHSHGQVLGPAVAGQMHYTLKEPMGVVVVILPSNFPLLLFVWEAAAALAAGNAVIVKPSEYASLTTLKFMEAFADLPRGLVQCVTGGGEVGRQLVEHSDTHMVGFTGSVPTGQAIARACAETFKPHLIEASGNDPFIVMPSAPLQIAARAVTFAAFMNCGQVCTSAERIYVHTDIYDQFARLVVAETAKLRIGNGLDKVDVGPMGNAQERDRFERLLAHAVEQGASVAFGGERPEGFSAGFFHEPTVLVDVTPEMDVLHGEVYGPLAPLCRVSSFDEAIELANASPFGLGATVYTTDLVETHRAAREIQSGMVWINAPILDNDAGPFGGRKMSGTGRQLGTEGLDTFRHTKLVMVDPAADPQDFWWFPYSDDEAWNKR